MNWKPISVDSTVYYYKIHIVDLDIKPIEKLEKNILKKLNFTAEN